MSFSTNSLRLAPVFLVLLTPVHPPVRGVEDRHARLQGTWLLNLEKSDSERQQFGRGYGGGSPGGRGPGRGGGRGEQPPEDVVEGFPMPGPGGGDRGLTEVLRPKQRFEIVQTDSMITVKDDAGWERELLPDQGKMREELGQGGPAEVETKWKGDKLVTTRKLDRGGEIEEAFSLDQKTGQLVVQFHFKTPRMQRAIAARRVYDPAPPAP